MERKLYPCKECGAKVPVRSKGLCPPCRDAEEGAGRGNYAYSKESHKEIIQSGYRKKR